MARDAAGAAMAGLPAPDAPDALQTVATVEALLQPPGLLAWQLRGLTPAARAAIDARLQRLLDALGDAEQAAAVDALIRALLETPAAPWVRQRIDAARLPPGDRAARAAAPASAIDAPQAERAAQDAAASLARGLRATAHPDGDAAPAVWPVWYATNRMPLTEPPWHGSVLADALAWGCVGVPVPVDGHRMGRVHQRPWWQRWLLPFDGAADELPLQPPRRFGAEDAFAAALRADLVAAAQRDVLVFVHGCNVSFDDAARRAAQLALDLDFGGAVVLFSWASWASLLRYTADEARAEASAPDLAGMLAALDAALPGRLHLLAHSMGSRIVVGALTRRGAPLARPGATVLAAADIGLDALRRAAPMLPAARTPGEPWPLTSYASGRDRALVLSRWLHAGPRAGFVGAGEPPPLLPGIETIDATAVGGSILGHDYASAERSVLADLSWMLGDRLPAARRRGLEAMPGGWWRFPP